MSTQTDTATGFRARIANQPRPALVWLGVLAVLLALEAGALLQFLGVFVAGVLEALPIWGDTAPAALASFIDATGKIPTLLSRETIPNAGYWNGQQYVGTFMGLAPHQAWALRAVLVYLYAFVTAAWLWVGYDRFRTHYREADWTPRDDVVDRFRNHYWGIFGLTVVFVFLVMALFAPALGPTTVEGNINNPYALEHEFKYWNANTDQVETTLPGEANRQSQSSGADANVGPFSYDSFGRYHPFGTLKSGKDLFTFIVAGSRISLLIGILSVALSATIATVFALVSAYYKGRVDDGFVLVSDAVMAMPQLLLLILLAKMLSKSWIGDVYNGGFALALIFAGTGWPYMWRSLRGPALQVAEREWVDAARSFGQSPWQIMKKHMFPYIVGYLLIYGSMTLGGAIVAVAGLSFLTPELGVQPPTPEWGRAINIGQDYVDTASWHISLIPGILITLVVTGFNALGDGIRDAVDPQADAGEGGEAAGRGGGA